MSQVHGLHDAEGRELCDPAEEADRGVRHQLPHHQLPHRGDVAPQAGGLRHPLHGGDRQGDIRDEVISQLQSQDLR